MDSENKDDNINSEKLINALFQEYCVSVLDWKEFLDYKDLGIALIDGWYKIVDEKKWSLTKINYGI